jgi:PKD repeat protein
MTPRPHARRLLAAFAALLTAASLPAATYLPAPDSELARRAPVIVRATVVSKQARLERAGSGMRPFTIATLQRLENLKGSTGETVSVRLPGGRVGEVAWWLPGTPDLEPGAEVVLMLDRDPDHPGLYRLTEFGLSKFDLVADSAGRRFAIRPAFGAREDLALAGRSAPSSSLAEKSGLPVRDAGSFLAALRAAGRGEEVPDVAWASPASDGTSGGDAVLRKWVNIAGREPGDCGEPCLFRWFWDTGDSPEGVVTVTGTQSNLGNDDPNCGIDSICDVQNAVDQWSGISQTDVRYGGVAPSGNVVVHLDAEQSVQDGGSTWNTPLGCGGGVIGLGGPGDGLGPHSYRGDSPYYAPSSGEVSMRKVTCSTGYPARTFRTAVLHELGHTLGLGHPDDDGSGLAVESIHSTTTSADWTSAVMNSRIPLSRPDAPQADDVQAIRYYYGTAPAGMAPVASFAFSPAAPPAGLPVSFQDSSTGSPSGWNWDFGDSGSGGSNASSQQNPTHTFSAPGTYTVTLAAGNLAGTGTTTRQVVVVGAANPCTPDATSLCLNGGRFRVTASWQRQNGTTGAGAAVPLTGDAGYFWFFNSANVEVITKVLNGCFDPFNSYWVFAAGLTNVKVTLAVEDTSTGALKTYVNPLGTAFLPIQDTSAFSTCP